MTLNDQAPSTKTKLREALECTTHKEATHRRWEATTRKHAPPDALKVDLPAHAAPILLRRRRLGLDDVGQRKGAHARVRQPFLWV